jgi:16S rRNA processing protein RimM
LKPETQRPEHQRWVAVARILRARGNKGEVAAELLTDFPERLKQKREVYLSDAEVSREPRRVGLAAFWMDRNHPEQGIFHFEECGSISEAEKFRGEYVFLPIEQRVSLSPGQYFVSDLIGCSVFENARENPRAPASSPCSLASAPSLLGKVSAVQFTGEGVAGTPLLAVDTEQGELLVPLAEDICVGIRLAERRIDVILPEGLRDLNGD